MLVVKKFAVNGDAQWISNQVIGWTTLVNENEIEKIQSKVR